MSQFIDKEDNSVESLVKNSEKNCFLLTIIAACLPWQSVTKCN